MLFLTIHAQTFIAEEKLNTIMTQRFVILHMTRNKMVPKQIGVTMTKLWPLLNPRMLFYEMCFCTKLLQCFVLATNYSMCHYVGFLQISHICHVNYLVLYCNICCLHDVHMYLQKLKM